MKAVESPEAQELHKLGNGAWDNPAYSSPPSLHGTLRICTISSVVPPQPQSKQPEDGPQEKAPKTLVSSCCLQICRSIRGTWLGGGVFSWERSQERGHQKFSEGHTIWSSCCGSVVNESD